jgi:tetratricopeptide (TPR) repeat protein
LAFALVERDSGNLKYALSHLNKIAGLTSSVNPVWRGKFFNERGRNQRRLKQRDEAIISYEGARVAFEEAGDAQAYAVSSFNLAGVLIDCGRFADAHTTVDHAIELLKSAPDASYLARAYDQKALISLAENRHADAIEICRKALSILLESEKREWLGESLVTYARAVGLSGEPVEALSKLQEAELIADYIESDDLRLLIANARKEIADHMSENADKCRIAIALKQSEGSYRSAAQKLDMCHSVLMKYASRYGLTRSQERPRSIISKPLK